jgi:hypothetical protein
MHIDRLVGYIAYRLLARKERKNLLEHSPLVLKTDFGVNLLLKRGGKSGMIWHTTYPYVRGDHPLAPSPLAGNG